jgi:uncharacterized metal-binding protein
MNSEGGYNQIRPAKTRIAEIASFAKKMSYKRLGLAFCLGLRKEAKAVENIFSSNGFEMVSAVCKVGELLKRN